MSKEPRVYLDHAATTPLRKEVQEHMTELLKGPFGNPSSTHGYGRKAKIIVEECRKAIAGELNCQPGEIIFTSGGTEADNAALWLPVRDLDVKRIITSPLEHQAVLNTAQRVAENTGVELELLEVDEYGRLNMDQLEQLLKSGEKTLVSLMHGNNEIGNLNDLQKIGDLVHEYGGIFHSDTVQTVGHYPLDLSSLPVDMISASAHKFYGPKGVGFLYISGDLKVGPYISGGSQERNRRGGTENVLSIGGLHTAFTQAYQNLKTEREHILGLKEYFANQMQQILPEVQFNGLSAELDQSLYSVLSAEFPMLEDDTMLTFNLDLEGIAVSGGSACASGSNQGSHVIETIKPLSTAPVVRFSFGKDNTRAELDEVLEVLKKLPVQV